MSDTPVPVIRVNITQKNIDDAIRAKGGLDMFSEAIIESYPTANYVTTDLQTMRFSVQDVRYFYLTPQRAQRQMLLFDRGEQVEPFSFTLRDGIAKHRKRAR